MHLGFAWPVIAMDLNFWTRTGETTFDGMLDPEELSRSLQTSGKIYVNLRFSCLNHLVGFFLCFRFVLFFARGRALLSTNSKHLQLFLYFYGVGHSIIMYKSKCSLKTYQSFNFKNSIPSQNIKLHPSIPDPEQKIHNIL